MVCVRQPDRKQWKQNKTGSIDLKLWLVNTSVWAAQLLTKNYRGKYCIFNPGPIIGDFKV